MEQIKNFFKDVFGNPLVLVYLALIGAFALFLYLTGPAL